MWREKPRAILKAAAPSIWRIWGSERECNSPKVAQLQWGSAGPGIQLCFMTVRTEEVRGVLFIPDHNEPWRQQWVKWQWRTTQPLFVLIKRTLNWRDPHSPSVISQCSDSLNILYESIQACMGHREQPLTPWLSTKALNCPRENSTPAQLWVKLQ